MEREREREREGERERERERERETERWSGAHTTSAFLDNKHWAEPMTRGIAHKNI